MTVSCDNIDMIYCNYKTSDVTQISILDMQVGDDIILGVKEAEISRYVHEQGTLKIEQLQLGMQRFN